MQKNLFFIVLFLFCLFFRQPETVINGVVGVAAVGDDTRVGGDDNKTGRANAPTATNRVRNSLHAARRLLIAVD